MQNQIIQWKKEYSIGIAEIDEQHKILVDIVNKFISAKMEGKQNDVFKETLTDIVDYTKYHFTSEENHMTVNKYFGLHEHKKQHQVLINQIVNVLNHLKEGKVNVDDELISLLQSWLIIHMMEHDKEYGRFLNDKS